MGKMKALLIDNEEVDGQEGQQDDDLSLCEEAHYHHVINDFVSLIEVYGWEKVIGDLRVKMGDIKW
jgi:hypothetical protein